MGPDSSSAESARTEMVGVGCDLRRCEWMFGTGFSHSETLDATSTMQTTQCRDTEPITMVKIGTFVRQTLLHKYPPQQEFMVISRLKI